MVIGHGKTILAECIGTIIMHTKYGKKRISNILYVLRLFQNFLSIAQLLHNSFSMIFKDQVCVVYNPQEAEMQGSRWLKIHLL